MLWRLKVYEKHCERDRKELSERLQQYSDCESFLFGAQTTIYISLFLIKAVVRAVKFVFAINIKKIHVGRIHLLQKALIQKSSPQSKVA